MSLTKPDQTERARRLRKSDTAAEQRLWEALRGRRLAGLKFVRQLPIGPYYADFVCRAKRLIIEVDGDTVVLPGGGGGLVEATVWYVVMLGVGVRFGHMLDDGGPGGESPRRSPVMGARRPERGAGPPDRPPTGWPCLRRSLWR